MADFDSVCSRLYEEIREKLCRDEDETLRFAIRGTAKTVLRPANLGSFFGSLTSRSGSRPPWHGLTEEVFIKRVDERDLYDFLAVLIFASCSIKEASVFVSRLVAPLAWPDDLRERCRLPASRESLGLIFQSKVTADKFYGKQACFCPVVLRKGEEVRITEPSSWRLPIISETRRGDGAFGQVWEVLVAPRQVWDSRKEEGYKYNADPIKLARKDYIKSEDFPRPGQEEHAVLMSIFESSPGDDDHQNAGHRNIVENWGSISIGPDRYSLFMSLANYDLHRWMMVEHTTRPNTNQHKAEILAGAMGLAAGLEFLHSGIPTSRFEKVVCYHMDLKPENVLIFNQERGPPIWKISDFNMSRIKTKERGQTDVQKDDGFSEGRDFNRFFVARQKRRQKGQTAAANGEPSATLNRRGDGAYMPPEAMSPIPSMTAKSDVWSLGCIVSVVMTFMDGGAVAVTDYETKRIEDPNSDRSDHFFVQRKFLLSHLNDAVKDHHTNLVKSAGRRSSTERLIVDRLLKDLEKKALAAEPEKRCTAETVRKMLKAAHDEYRTLPGGDETDKSSLDAASVMTPEFALEPGDRQIEAWTISTHKSYKGCEISPDGALLAYWTDKTIALYTAESLRTRLIEPVSTDELGRSDIMSIWKSISLTQRYLVAAVSSTEFKLKVFYLRRSRTISAPLAVHRPIIIPGLPEIQKLALSPDGRTLTCLLRNKADERQPGVLFHADFQSLLGCTNLAATVAMAKSQRPYQQVRLDWPASDVARMTVSDRRDVHLVIRPRQTARSREHKIPVVAVSFERATIKTLFIESRGFDSSSAVGFFTDFLPLSPSTPGSADGQPAPPAEAEAVLVTHEKRLHLQSFPAAGAADRQSGDDRDEQCDVKGYRLLRLLEATADRVWALGTSAVSKRMLLLVLELNRPADGPARVGRVTELVRLPGLAYGDEFVARLAEAPPTRGLPDGMLPPPPSGGGHEEGGGAERDGDPVGFASEVMPLPPSSRETGEGSSGRGGSRADEQEDEGEGDDEGGEEEQPERHLLIATLAATSGRRAVFRVALNETGLE